ncbi:hypothetical protein DP113_05405 [Brasilonema octagenarum UFV-E1]|uniref:Uncharacterized protein n=1 Tax=Brasilonema sennae CENA114 TaxID=415709 RepID=A0A856M8D1_9CYAN|nr:hypothetical protein DP114_05455 [Brasilonema sennae CENA114]QDL13776.1 hypothetical protein DP113_05405 [Brasilonema octagenarum UFV-E1]
MAIGNARRLTPHSTLPEGVTHLQRGGSFSGEASPENVPWEPDSQSPQRSKLVAWVASPDKLWGNPNALQVRQSPTEVDPPAALVSPGPSVGKPSSRTGSLRERPSPTAGNPLGLRSAPYACGTATPIGASCTPVPWLGGNPTASRHNGGNPRKALLSARGWLHNALNPTPDTK